MNFAFSKTSFPIELFISSRVSSLCPGFGPQLASRIAPFIKPRLAHIQNQKFRGLMFKIPTVTRWTPSMPKTSGGQLCYGCDSSIFIICRKTLLLFLPAGQVGREQSSEGKPPEPPLLARERALQNNQFSRLYKAISGTSKKPFLGTQAYRWSLAYHEKEVTYFLRRPGGVRWAEKAVLMSKRCDGWFPKTWGHEE